MSLLLESFDILSRIKLNFKLIKWNMEAKNLVNNDEQFDQKLQMGDDDIKNQVKQSTEILTECNKKSKSLKIDSLMEVESNLDNILIPEFPIVK